jgi:extracellular matrix regulatory protein B
MFLNLGDGHLIPIKDVVMIGNIKTTYSETTNNFLNISEEEGFIVNYASDKAKSFVLTNETIYFSIISSNTLANRINKALELGG